MVVKPKVAVIGTGSLGKEHARIYSELAQRGEVDFVGIHDHSTEAARKVADKLHVPIFRSLEEAAAAAEAFSVVTPTVTHFDIASALLRQGKHVLVEKPMTDNSDQAAVLVDLARTKNLILQVGHVERFNPVFHYLKQVATQPRFIECHRLSPFPATLLRFQCRGRYRNRYRNRTEKRQSPSRAAERIVRGDPTSPLAPPTDEPTSTVVWKRRPAAFP